MGNNSSPSSPQAQHDGQGASLVKYVGAAQRPNGRAHDVRREKFGLVFRQYSLVPVLAAEDAHVPEQVYEGGTPAVELRQVRRIYKMGGEAVHALDGVDLTIRRGEFMSIMGRSGSGKSTLLNVIGCLDRPTAGAVFIDGEEVSRLSSGRLPKIRRDKIGFVFQQHNLVPVLTAEENVMLPLRYAGVGTRERRERSRAALDAVGLGDRLRHRPTQLSGGQMQRVAIARALVTEPAIVLADEPTGEVDSQTSAIIIDLMRRLNRERNQTFIIVTHDPGVAIKTDRVVRLSDGRIELDARIYTRPGETAPAVDLPLLTG